MVPQRLYRRAVGRVRPKGRARPPVRPAQRARCAGAVSARNDGALRRLRRWPHSSPIDEAPWVPAPPTFTTRAAEETPLRTIAYS